MNEKLGHEITIDLEGMPEEEYKERYSDHIIDVYKTYLEMADRISSRRERANSFFLTLNTVVVGYVGYIIGNAKVESTEPWLVLIAIAGVSLSYLWYRIIISYRGLNTAKFEVIHEIEKKLPIKPYYAEWEVVGRGKDRKLYVPFTHIEQAVPWIFIVLHILVIVRVCLAVGAYTL